MQTRMSVKITNGVADVRLNRPAKHNALDPLQFQAIAATIKELSTLRQLRVVVLSGEGKSFCAGVDTDALSESSNFEDMLTRTHGIANRFQFVAWGWRELPVPVIAAIHGNAFGAGFQLMLGADIRIAAPEAKLSLMEARWGLAPDVGGIALLRGLVRDDIARELTYTGRIMTGVEAAELGVVTRAAPDPLGEAFRLAETIANHHPAAMRADKRLLNLMATASTEDILLAESQEQSLLLASKGHRETLIAAREGRPPKFED